MSVDPETSPQARVRIEPDAERGFVRIRVTGRFEMAEAARRQGEVAATYPRMHRLWDLREANLAAWTAPEIRLGIDEIAGRTSEGAGEGLRVAGLVTRDLEFGVTRMFESMAGGKLPMRYAVFRDEERAIEWLVTGE
jgi:hypothetical protein